MQLKLTLNVPMYSLASDVVADLLTLTAASGRLRGAIDTAVDESRALGDDMRTGVIRDPRTNAIAGMWELAPEDVTA